MKKLRYTTTSEYVDKDTGEILTKEQVNKEYIIIKKIKKRTVYEQYVREKYGTQILTKFGLITITNECTRSGKQLEIFK